MSIGPPARSATQDAETRRRVDFTPSGKSVTHGGSGTAYAHYGCRCDECTVANTARSMRRRARDREARAATYLWGATS